MIAKRVAKVGAGWFFLGLPGMLLGGLHGRKEEARTTQMRPPTSDPPPDDPMVDSAPVNLPRVTKAHPGVFLVKCLILVIVVLVFSKLSGRH